MAKKVAAIETNSDPPSGSCLQAKRGRGLGCTAMCASADSGSLVSVSREKPSCC